MPEETERVRRAPAPAGVPPHLLRQSGADDADLLDRNAARIAGLVEQAVSRYDGMLFTATPTQDLDAVIASQHLLNQAFALQLRTLTATSNRAIGDERYWVSDEVGLALGLSAVTGDALLRLATQACELPGLLEAVEANLLTDRHLRAVVRTVCDADLALTLEHRQAVVAIMLTRYTGQTPNELTKLLSKLILQIDLAAAQRRQELADTARGIRAWERVNGQASVMLTGPKPQIGAVLAALARQDSISERQPGDERSHDNRLFDLAVALLTGGAEAQGGWEATIVIPYSTATGGDLELAEIPGLGPVLPSTARDLLDGALRHRRVSVDDSGTVIAVDDAVAQPRSTASKTHASKTTGPTGTDPARWPPVNPAVLAQLQRLASAPVVHHDLSTHRYAVPGRLRRHLEARDRTCVFPGCARPASLTDKDHRIPWPLGATDLPNLQCLCRRHHRAKQAAFTVAQHPDGTHTWTTRRTGHTRDRPPHPW